MKLTEFDLTNWRQHPTNKRYQVFFYKTIEEGRYFELLLNEHKIDFEAHIEDENTGGKYRVFYAVHVNDMETCKYLNNLVIGKFREPFIPFKWLRIFLITVSIIVLILAIIGYIVSKT